MNVAAIVNPALMANVKIVRAKIVLVPIVIVKSELLIRLG